MTSRDYFANVDEESGSQASELQKRRLLDPITSDSEEEPYFYVEGKELTSTDYSFQKKVYFHCHICIIDPE
jgi:hypothetical protein